jgi:hypothetical protein
MTTKTKKNPFTRTFRIDKPIIASTNGNGYWSSESRKTTIRTLGFDGIYGDLKPVRNGRRQKPWICVYVKAFFTGKDWNIHNHGLIYTDNKWMKEFREGFKSLKRMKGFGHDIDYTEQGMQGENFVSMSFTVKGRENIEAFARAFGIPMWAIENECSSWWSI